MINPILSGIVRDTAQKFIKTRFHKRISISEFEIDTFGVLNVNTALRRIIQFIQKHVPKYEKKDLNFTSYNWLSIACVLNNKFFFMDGNVILFSKEIQTSAGTTLCIDIYGLDANEISKIFGKIIYSAVSQYTSGENDVLPITTICGSKVPDISTFRGKREMPNLRDIAGNSAEKVFSVIQRFTNSKKLYRRYRIPYNIKILLHGKPGTGKTSMALAIAKHYSSRVVLVSSDSDIYKLEGNAIARINDGLTLYLFEEIDVILEKYKNDNNGIDALLQFLNGASELSNSIIIMTTNYIDNIDSRILRARRVDYSFEVMNLPYDEVLPMAKRFHITKDELDTCLSKCLMDENSNYNPAEVEGAILEYCKEYKIKEVYQ